MSQPPYGQPGYAPPSYGQPQYGQPQYGQPQYGQPQHGQPQYGQPQYPAQPYQQPGWGQPPYGSYGPGQYGAPRPRPNPVAGILLAIGGIMGLLAALIPHSGGKVPFVAAIDGIKYASEGHLAEGAAANVIMPSVCILVTAVFGILCLLLCGFMFASRSHKGVAGFALVCAMVLLVSAGNMAVWTDGLIFDIGGFADYMLLLAGVPALIGAIVGIARK